MKLGKIQEKLKKVQNERRYEHTLGVAYTATCLAYRYGEDPEKARLAGLLHDCAKHLSGEKALEMCAKYDLPVNNIEKNNPFLLHGKVGALIAQKKFNVDDEDILNAITYHTTGRPGMSLLEKIIYVSDYIEPNRDFASNLDTVRNLAFENLDMALMKILEDILKHLLDKNLPTDPMTQKTFDYYIKEQLINGK